MNARIQRMRVLLLSIIIGVVMARYDALRVRADWNSPWPNGTTMFLKHPGGYDGPLHNKEADFGLDFNFGGGNDDCGMPVTAIKAGSVRRSACSGKRSDLGYGCHIELLHGGGV